MPSIPVRSSIITTRFIDDAFDYLASPAYWRIGGMEIDAPLGPDSLVTTCRKFGPFDIEMMLEVIKYSRPYLLCVSVTGRNAGFRSRKRGMEPLEQEYRLESAPQGSRITLIQRQKFWHPLIAPLALILYPLAWWGLNRGMRKLKAQLESAIE